jgi:hypothetical protein
MRMIGMAEIFAVMNNQVVSRHDGINKGQVLSRMRYVGKMFSDA